MRRRAGFTITELLVAMALILFIMAVLSEAFVAGLESFRQLKSVGDMDQRLRTAMTLLRRDLDANWLQVTRNAHVKPSALTGQPPLTGFFSVGADAGGAVVTASGPAVLLQTNPPPAGLAYLKPNRPVLLVGPAGTPPAFVFTSPNYRAGTNPIVLAAAAPLGVYTNALWEGPDPAFDSSGAPGSTTAYTDGTDGDGILSPYATSYRLHFSVDLGVAPPTNPAYKPDRRENYIAATAPATITAGAASIYSPLIYQTPTLVPFPATSAPGLRTPFQDTANYLAQQGEVAYFLRTNGSTTPGGTPLYSLYRRQLALVSPADQTVMNATVQATLPIAAAQWANAYYDFSAVPAGATQMSFGTAGDVSDPRKRCLSYFFYNGASLLPAGWNAAAFPKLGDRGEPAGVQGADLLLTDVLSFTVRVLPNPTPTGRVDPYVFPGETYTAGTQSYKVFGQHDTANAKVVDLFNQSGASVKFAGIEALEITLRVWDQKTQRTRQVTVVQAM